MKPIVSFDDVFDVIIPLLLVEVFVVINIALVIVILHDLGVI